MTPAAPHQLLPDSETQEMQAVVASTTPSTVRRQKGSSSSSSSHTRRVGRQQQQTLLGIPPKRAANHAFSTRFAFILTAVSLCLLCILSLLLAESSSSEAVVADGGSTSTARWLDQVEDDTDYSQYSCSYIYKETPYRGDRQCQFARQCNQGEGLWASHTFCSKTFSTTFLAALYSPVLLLWLVLLFRMLASTAEDYFSPALEMFAVKLGLPPRFAGVSLLALGNGAADVSATVSAFTSDPATGYQLSLGALTGAAMFISCVVSAVVVLVADGVPCRGALVRDATVLTITTAVVWRELGATGRVGPDTISLFLAMYFCYAILVLVADIYHRAVVVPRLAVTAQRQERERQLEIQHLQQHGGGGGGVEAATGSSSSSEENSPTAAAGVVLPPHPPGRLAQVITALSNYDNQDVPAGGWGVESDDLAQDRPVVLHGAHGILRGDGHLQSAVHAELTTTTTTACVTIPAEGADSGGNYSMLEDATDRFCVEPGSAGFPASNWWGALEDGKQELLDHASAVWDDIVWNGDVHVVSKFLLLCELPFTVLRKITIPIPCEGYYVRALIALSLALSPLWYVYYLWDAHDYNILANGGWLYVLVVWLLFCVGAMFVLRYSPGGEGNMALLLSTPIALYGFVIAASWIDKVADALVSVLNFIGVILRIPPPVIGLTILAWGNSMADLSANATMARKGLGNMAMTACFAGPVFNILVGLGLGFASLAQKTGETEKTVSLSHSVVTGFVFLALNSAAILITGLAFGQGKIQKTYGYIALTLYAVYLVVSITLQYRV